MTKALILLDRKWLEDNDCTIMGDITKPILVNIKEDALDHYGWIRLEKPIEVVWDEDGEPVSELYEDEFTIVMEITDA